MLANLRLFYSEGWAFLPPFEPGKQRSKLLGRSLFGEVYSHFFLKASWPALPFQLSARSARGAVLEWFSEREGRTGLFSRLVYKSIAYPAPCFPGCNVNPRLPKGNREEREPLL